MSRRPRGGRPGRKTSASAVRREIRVFAEGIRTEETYLVHWARKNRSRVIVTFDDFRGGPKQLVERAVTTKHVGAREARRGRGRAFDEIWCIFDVDEHPGLADALSLAQRHGIRVAVSNPCIELWFLLHFEDQNAHIDRRAAQSRAQRLMGCGKALSPEALEKLEGGYESAKTRAIGLDRKHSGDASPPGSNPSSSVWRLVDSIEGAP